MSKWLGIDYGRKRIGLAVAQMEVGVAHPFKVIDTGTDSVKKIMSIIVMEEIDFVVMGLPLSLDGTEGPQAEEVRKFAGELSDQLDFEIYFQDERLTSREADGILTNMEKNGKQKRKFADAHQAAIILQTHIDSLSEG
jgi:putative Holliday junction resolvase